MKRIALLLAAVLLAACSNGDGPTAPQGIAGVWTGAVNGTTFTVNLKQSGVDVTLGATLTGAGRNPITMYGNGTFAGRTLSITLLSFSYQPMSYTATLSGRTLTGNLNGSGWRGETLVLTKQ